MSALTDEEIDECSDSMRNALGGIYHTSVYEFARAIIAANNAKVLADLEPLSLRLSVSHANGGGVPMTGALAGNVTEYQKLTDVYSADQVSALIQDRDALAARVKELNDLLAKSLVTNMQLKATP